MKQIFLSMAFLSYCIITAFILCIAIGYVFIIDDVPKWTPFLLYPVTIFICASQDVCINYFMKHLKV